MIDAGPTRKASDEAPLTASERVRKYRQALKNRKRKRLEACIDVTVIDEMVGVAKELNIPVWKAVENALATAIDEFHALEAERLRLRRERPRAEQSANPLQIQTFNLELQRYKARLSRFLGPRVTKIGQSELA